MYSIYINDNLLQLVASDQLSQRVETGHKRLVMPYFGKPKIILNCVDKLEKNPRQTICLHYHDVEQLFEDFKSYYRIVEAAGGVVQNEKGQTLFIFRRGSWDLPKGKIDPGETPAIAAIREVQEETGLQEVALGTVLPTTYHTYRDKKERRVLKPTYWFNMETTDTDLIPQTEEDIEAAIWYPLHQFLAENRPMYASLLGLLKGVK